MPPVPERATQGTDTRVRDWTWVEASIWTERMLSALDNGVKGSNWFSLVDPTTADPPAYFAQAGLFAMHAGWLGARQPR